MHCAINAALAGAGHGFFFDNHMKATAPRGPDLLFRQGVERITASMKILIVDDNDDIRDLLGSVVEELD